MHQSVIKVWLAANRALLAHTSLHYNLQVQSTMGTVCLEDVAAAGKGAGAPLLIFQLYVFADRELTRSLVQRARWAPSPAPDRLDLLTSLSCMLA